MIIEDKTNEVVSRIDVTSQLDRNIDKIHDGIFQNLNHSEFSVIENESNEELPEVKL